MVTPWSQDFVLARTSGAELVIATAGMLTAIATCGAAVAAAVAARRAAEATRASVDLVEIERQRFAVEEEQRATAELRFDVIPTRSSAYRLLVTNGGPSAAKDVVVRFYDPTDPGTPYHGIPQGSTGEMQQDRLAPGEEIALDTIPHGGGISVGFDVSWTDTRGRIVRKKVLDRPR